MGQEIEQYQEMQLSATTVGLMSPNKMLVESATMIFILVFMLFSMVMLVESGQHLEQVK